MEGAVGRTLTANAICPGTIQTPSLDGRVADLSKSAHKPVNVVRQDFIDRQPMGRLGTAQEGRGAGGVPGFR